MSHTAHIQAHWFASKRNMVGEKKGRRRYRWQKTSRRTTVCCCCSWRSSIVSGVVLLLISSFTPEMIRSTLALALSVAAATATPLALGDLYGIQGISGSTLSEFVTIAPVMAALTVGLR